MKRKLSDSGQARQGAHPIGMGRTRIGFGCQQASCLFPPRLEGTDIGSLGSDVSSLGQMSSSNQGSAKAEPSGGLLEGERLLIQDMNNLSTEERERVYEEVHGVTIGDEVEESPAMVDAALAEIKADLDKPNRHFPEYDRAAFLVPHRVQDRDFLLKFLRREKFQAKPAALMIRRFFKFSLEWFGVNGLLRDVCVGDLTDDDRDVLRTAFCHMPAARLKDRMGRPIILFFPSHIKYKDPYSVLRILFCLYWKSLRDEMAQKRGVISVCWAYGNSIPTFPPSVLAPSAAVYAAVPIRLSAIHICYDQLAITPFLEVVKLTVGRSLRIRMRTHFGSPMESRYSLLTFGIDASTFPITLDGAMDPSSFLQWLEQEVQAEAEQASQTTPVIPSATDILLGRGQPFRIFPGNQDLTRMVDENYEAYNTLKMVRRGVIESVAHQVLDVQGRRFLKRDSPTDPWYAVSRKEAVKKIDASFRNKKVVDRYHQEKHTSSSGLLEEDTTNHFW